MWACSNAPNQQWLKDGNLTYRNRAAGLCLDATTDSRGNPNTNGDAVQLWAGNGNVQQRWN